MGGGFGVRGHGLSGQTSVSIRGRDDKAVVATVHVIVLLMYALGPLYLPRCLWVGV